MTVADTLAPYHNEVRGGISFADGHSEIRMWNGAATKPLVTSSGSLPRSSFV
jgi:prepilin-type processing-associated H-X9-DG protein